MSENTKYDYSSLDIHLPQRKVLTSNLQLISFILNDIVLAISLLALFAWFTDMYVMRITLFESLHIYPFSAVQFLFAGSSLLFSAKRHFFNTKNNTLDKRPAWTIFTPILLATLIAVLGFINFAHVNHVRAAISTTPFSGFCFLLIGLGLIPPHTRIPHRFHITQLLVFTVLILNLFTILETVYQVLSSTPTQHIIFVPFPTAIIFALFCFGILWRWSNRGFFGNFTIESADSILALRSLIVNFITAPLAGFMVLTIAEKLSYNVYQVATLVIVSITLVSALISWINVKLLYKHDLEHFLMRESLRVHNIDLKLNKEAQEAKMTELNQEKQHYLEKLNYQSKFREVAEGLD